MESAGWSPAFGEHAAEEQEETLKESRDRNTQKKEMHLLLYRLTPYLEAIGFVTFKKTNLCTEPYLEAESDTAQSQSSKGSSPRHFHIQSK